MINVYRVLPQLRGLMSLHIKNPDAIQKLDGLQKKRPLGVLYRLFGLYPVYLVMRLLGMKLQYWKVHRCLYMGAHREES